MTATATDKRGLISVCTAVVLSSTPTLSSALPLIHSLVVLFPVFFQPLEAVARSRSSAAHSPSTSSPFVRSPDSTAQLHQAGFANSSIDTLVPSFSPCSFSTPISVSPPRALVQPRRTRKPAGIAHRVVAPWSDNCCNPTGLISRHLHRVPPHLAPLLRVRLRVNSGKPVRLLDSPMLATTRREWRARLRTATAIIQTTTTAPALGHPWVCTGSPCSGLFERGDPL